MNAVRTEDCAQARLLAYAIDGSRDWHGHVAAALEGHGFEARRRGGALLAWHRDNRIQLRAGVEYADCCRIHLEHMGAGHHSLAVVPQRVYFLNGETEPTSEPEYTINPLKRPISAPSAKLAACLKVGSLLGSEIRHLGKEPVAPVLFRSRLESATQIEAGNGGIATAGSKLSLMLQTHGFHAAPDRLHFILAAEQSEHPSLAAYQHFLARAFARCKVHASFDVVPTASVLLDRLNNHAQGCDRPVVVVAVKGSKGDTLSPAESKMIRDLEGHGYPFRMYSLDNRSLDWSALDQAGSLVAAAGGISHILHLPWTEKHPTPFVLGVDLGHPRATEHSVVAFSLLDHRGVHLATLRTAQRRDETVRERTLKTGLRWAREEMARRLQGRHFPGVLILRDGRLFENEPMRTYSDAFDGAVTLVEFTKRMTPVMFVPGDKLRSAPGGCEFRPSDGETSYVVPLPPRLSSDLARVFKVRVRGSADGLGLGLSRTVEILVGLAYSPSLGLAPHALPGPLYWADGIAAISETNHQFSGQTIVPDPMQAASESKRGMPC